MPWLSTPPASEHRSPDTWLYRCAAPMWHGRKCGVLLEGYEREATEVWPSSRAFREYAPGPVIRHLPCGHEWLIKGGWLN